MRRPVQRARNELVSADVPGLQSARRGPWLVAGMSVEPFELVLERLNVKQRNGTSASALCPAHPDRSPSLSVARRDDGAVLLHCHRDCSVDDVVAAIDLRASDLFPETPQREERPRIVATYDYTDGAGQLLYQVVRLEPKTFRQRRPDGKGGWIWKLGDTPRVPYRLPEVLGAVKAQRTVFVVEGEKDADALVAAGYTATCNPGGAGKWAAVAATAREVLAGADVIIAADRDQRGRNHAAEVARSLLDVAASVTIVEPVLGKDVAEHLGAGHTVEQLTIVAGINPDDPPLDVWAGDAQVDDNATADQAERPPRLTFETIPDPFVIPPIEWLASGLLVHPTHGELAGPEKSLKTYIGVTVDVGLATGLDVLGRWPVARQCRVLLLVGEGGRAGFLRRLARICGAYGVAPEDVRPWLRYSFETAPTSSARFVDSVTEQLDDFQPDVVHLDPWYAYAPGDADARNLYETGAALERLGQLVRSGGASLLINNHFNQPAAATDCSASRWPATPNGATRGCCSPTARHPMSTPAGSASSSTSAHGNGAADRSTSTTTSAASIPPAEPTTGRSPSPFTRRAPAPSRTAIPTPTSGSRGDGSSSRRCARPAARSPRRRSPNDAQESLARSYSPRSRRSSTKARSSSTASAGRGRAAVRQPSTSSHPTPKERDRWFQTTTSQVPRQNHRSRHLQRPKVPSCQRHRPAGQTAQIRWFRTIGLGTTEPSTSKVATVPGGYGVPPVEPSTVRTLNDDFDDVLAAWRGDPATLLAELDDGTAAAATLARWITATRPDWFTDAACRRPEHRHVSFFPELGQRAAPAKAVCAACPVLEACEVYVRSLPPREVARRVGRAVRRRPTRRSHRRDRGMTGVDFLTVGVSELGSEVLPSPPNLQPPQEAADGAASTVG